MSLRHKHKAILCLLCSAEKNLSENARIHPAHPAHDAVRRKCGRTKRSDLAALYIPPKANRSVRPAEFAGTTKCPLSGIDLIPLIRRSAGRRSGCNKNRSTPAKLRPPWGIECKREIYHYRRNKIFVRGQLNCSQLFRVSPTFSLLIKESYKLRPGPRHSMPEMMTAIAPFREHPG